MGEEKPEPLDFVKDFQEYLSQQTQHVNMISGSVIGVKDTDVLQGGIAYRTFLLVVFDWKNYLYIFFYAFYALVVIPVFINICSLYKYLHVLSLLPPPPFNLYEICTYYQKNIYIYKI